MQYFMIYASPNEINASQTGFPAIFSITGLNSDNE